VKVSDPLTGTGTNRFDRDPSPTCPQKLSPQQNADPVVVIPHACPVPDTTVLNRPGIVPTAVALNVTGGTPAAVAVIAFAPAPAPSVQLPTRATPAVSVVALAPVMVPPPALTANVTTTPRTGFALASSALTAGEIGVCIPGYASW
jgi:hypothetical protein